MQAILINPPWDVDSFPASLAKVEALNREPMIQFHNNRRYPNSKIQQVKERYRYKLLFDANDKKVLSKGEP